MPLKDWAIPYIAPMPDFAGARRRALEQQYPLLELKVQVGDLQAISDRLQSTIRPETRYEVDATICLNIPDALVLCSPLSIEEEVAHVLKGLLKAEQVIVHHIEVEEIERADETEPEV